jgi:site-specific DNA-methyltransferase (adenine-specific)
VKYEDTLVHGDALRLRDIVSANSVELAYLDPPFFVGSDFAARPRATGGSAVRARAKGPVAYSDRWPSFEVYLAWLARRVELVHALLSNEGSLWLHLDHRAIHEAKLLTDAIFGREHFLGEVIWVPGNGTKARKGPGITHQTLLVYSKSSAYVWNVDSPELREPFAKTSLAMHFGNVDDDGRRFRERVVNGKTYRYYADRGRALGSVWTDCPAMVANTPLRREATGYPTQKPEKLLERIVRASSREGSLVLDAFCGSGTTLAVAARCGRRFVGSDIGELAMRTTRDRLKAAGVPFRFLEAEDTRERAPTKLSKRPSSTTKSKRAEAGARALPRDRDSRGAPSRAKRRDP